MVRGFSRGYSRGGSYRGSNRGNSSWNGSSRGNYSNSRFSSSSSFSSPMDSRSRYGPERFSPRPHPDEYKSYRSDSSYMMRDRRSPERKRMRTDAPSSRYDSYGGFSGSSRHEPPPSYSERRGYSGDIRPRREEYSRPPGPPRRGSSYRGRISSRGFRGLRSRDIPIRRRLIDSSYAIRKRPLVRSSFYSRRSKMPRMRSSIGRRRISDKDDDEKADDKADKSGEEKDGDDNEKTEESKGDKDGKPETLEEKLKKLKSFVKLACPHCGVKVLTFRRYELHLSSRTHIMAMRKIAIEQKSILGQMRAAQRNTQNELEKSTGELSERSNFCPLCKLNYKQKKAVHQLSEAHKNMKKFLMPSCKICNITFKSPMSYEGHCCSIKHLKRIQRGTDGSGEEDNLENFTTIDSVGEGDGGSENGEKEEPSHLGLEKVRKVEVHYCDLCKMYLPRGDESEMTEILSKHCKQKVHIRLFLRIKQREEAASQAVKKEVKEEKEEGKTDSSATEDKSDLKMEDEDARDDKLWADVDKDLGDILAEAESGNKSSDEDEEDSHVNGERYDRFKLSINDSEAKEIESEEK